MSNKKEFLTIKDSNVSSKAEIYRFAEIKNSRIAKNAIVGDFSRVINSNMEIGSKLDRSNLLYYSALGDNTYTGAQDMIFHSSIGKFCSISWGVTIGGGEHNYKRISSHDFFYNNRYDIKPQEYEDPYNRYGEKCIIGNDVWIGANSTILRGVEVGHGAIVGANSVVSKDVPPYAIVVGSPAKLIKYRFEKSIIKELLQLKWWDLPTETLKANYKNLLSEDILDVINKLRNQL